MLVLGHAGITLGAATLLAGAMRRKQTGQDPKLSWFAALSHYLDIRLLLVGSLLPDIIDKPVGQLFFREVLGSGRIYGHTLLFLVLITTTGLIIYQRWHRTWLLALAAGSLAHLVFDEIWNVPSVLFWPLLGFEFARIDVDIWLSGMLEGLLSDPAVFLPEAAGLLILLWFGLAIIRRNRVGAFIRYGKAG